MAIFEGMLLLAALAGAGETVLLDFSATWCAPCRRMEPVVEQLSQEGLPVRKVNIDQEKELAQHYRVVEIPCFVMLVDGREMDRVVGSTSYERLRKMFARAPQSAVGSPDTLGKQVADGQGAAPATTNTAADANPRGSSTGGSGLIMPDTLNSQQPELVERAMGATVRIRVHVGQSTSYGSGTIVDVHGEEALVVTCGHIFRDSAGRGRIEIDLFTPDGERTVAGQLVRYDLKGGKDMGLISMRPGVEIHPVSVAPRGYQTAAGNDVLVTGCDRGGTPIWLKTKVASINRYGGPDNIQVAGTPVDGRSGGGLFSKEGYLIGVCNAADPADREGFYAALPAIQSQLEVAGLSFVFEHAAPATNAPRSVDQRLRAAQIICILGGDDSNPRNKEVILLEDASPELLEYLALEVEKQRTDSSASARMSDMPANSAEPRMAGVPREVVRAQNPRRVRMPWKGNH